MDEEIFSQGWKRLSKSKSCAQIDNNQQVYEVHIQVPKCNSILKLFMSILPNWRTTYRHDVRWVALGLWSVCSSVYRSR
jgi:hypothetical protein